MSARLLDEQTVRRVTGHTRDCDYQKPDWSKPLDPYRGEPEHKPCTCGGIKIRNRLSPSVPSSEGEPT